VQARPVVDGIERQTRGVANVIRIDIRTEEGRRVADRYGIEYTPSYVIFDASGQALERLGAAGADTTDRLRALAGSSWRATGTMEGA